MRKVNKQVWPRFHLLFSLLRKLLEDKLILQDLTLILPNFTKFVSDKGNFFVGIGAFSKEKERFSKDIDGLVSYLVCRVFATLTGNYEGVKFSKCVDYSYYHGELGKHMYDFYPQMSGDVVVTKKTTLKDIKKLTRRLRKTKLSYKEKTVKLYRKMIDEQDNLKKFLFGYFSLEVASSILLSRIKVNMIWVLD
jgi:hypothetical protein